MLLCPGCRTKFIDFFQLPVFHLYCYLWNKYWRFYFFNLYYLYCLSIFQRTCCFRFKSGCKGKRFYFNCQMFSEVFFIFLFQLVSQALLRKGKNNYKRKSKTVLFANRTAKIRTFRFIFQTFSEVFLFLCLSRLTLYH